MAPPGAPIPSESPDAFSQPGASENIVARIQAGDQAALEQLFSKLYVPLLTYLTSQFGDPDTAEDAIQAVFIGIWNRREIFDPVMGVRAYCFAAARNHTYKLYRTNERMHRRETTAMAPVDHPAPPDRVLDDRMLQDAVVAALAAIPDRAREIFYLVREDGLTYAEAAHVLGISINTVKTQLARVSVALRAALGSALSLLVAALAK